MSLREFLKLLDTMMPVTIYYDCDEYGPYGIGKVPQKWLDQKVFQIFIEEDSDSIGIDVT